MIALSRLHNPKTVLSPDHLLPALLDSCRGLAALMVLLFHVRSALFAPYADISPHGGGIAAFYGVTSFGHAAVIVFFVLSGFLVGGLVLHMDWPGRLPSYGLDRAVRIVPVIFGAVAVSLLVQALHIARSGSPSCTLHLAMILGNMLNLQGFGIPSLCNNLALWSVSNEVTYYAAFPVLVAVAIGHRGTGLRVAFGVALAALAWSLVGTPLDDNNVALYFPVWLMGSALWFKAIPQARLVVALPLFLMALFATRSELAKSWFLASDLILGFCFTLVIGSLMEARAPGGLWAKSVARPFGRVLRWLSGISFSLYVTHYPLVRFFADWSNDAGPVLPARTISLSLVLGFVLLILFCLAFATLFSAIFEAPRQHFRQRLGLFLAGLKLPPFFSRPSPSGSHCRPPPRY